MSPAGFSINGGGGGGGGGDCNVCQGSYSDGTAVAFCVPPDDGSWGMTQCQVTCNSIGPAGTCTCTTSGYGCLYIVVNG